MKSLFLFAPALVLAGIAMPAAATAQQRGTAAQQANNARLAANLRVRLGQTEARIVKAERSRAIKQARATELLRQVAHTRQSMTALARRQGFVSAAEFASYNRTLGAIDVELDRRGVARSYGNDMLVAPEHSYGNDMLVAPERSYGNDALPSAEVLAFQRIDARLHYRDARIEYDAGGCAVYQGKASDGKIRRVRLLSKTGRPICTRR